MAKWANADVLDNGPEFIRTLANTSSRVQEHLIKAYSAGDSYATVTGNSVASSDVAIGDLVMSSNGSDRLMTVGTLDMGLATDDSGAAPDLHIALVDSVGSEVLLVTDETSNQVITQGNPVEAPTWAYTVAQPT